VVKLLRQSGIPYVIAPYEAYAQSDYIANAGYVRAVVTVDADFIVHGIPRVFYRVSWASGRCSFWEAEVAEKWEEWPDEEAWKTDFLSQVVQCGSVLITAYILAVGCDHNTKVEGVGPRRALAACKNLKHSRGIEAFKDVAEAIPFLAQHLYVLIR